MQIADNEDLTKAQWRARLIERRAAVSLQQRVLEGRSLTQQVLDLTWAAPGYTVCCYVPFEAEPGHIGLLDMLTDAGATVLLPVTPAEHGPLDWSAYAGTSSLISGKIPGLLEPSGPRLGAEALGDANLVLVPALAVDDRGVRLGRGAGYYDRSLPFVAAGAMVAAVVRDEELVNQLPAEDHDVRMHAVLTPGHGLARRPV